MFKYRLCRSQNPDSKINRLKDEISEQNLNRSDEKGSEEAGKNLNHLYESECIKRRSKDIERSEKKIRILPMNGR